MKSFLKLILQRVLGLHRYLVLHSIVVASTTRLRRYDRDILQFIARLPPDANVLDIGANVGTTAVLIARRCRLGTVYAFEPIPETFRAAQSVLRVFGVTNVRLVQIGLGERAESVTMIMPSSGPNAREHGRSHVVDSARDGGERGTRYPVELIALDNFAALDGIRISAIKIDVEDHERFVFRGGRGILARDRPVVFCELFGIENKSECFALFKELDYETFVAVGGGVVPYDPTSDTHVNFLFVPREQCGEYAVARA